LAGSELRKALSTQGEKERDLLKRRQDPDAEGRKRRRSASTKKEKPSYLTWVVSEVYGRGRETWA